MQSHGNETASEGLHGTTLDKAFRKTRKICQEIGAKLTYNSLSVVS